MEICEPYLTEEKISTEISQMNLDFILGSVHSIDGQGMNTFAEGLDGNDLYERYFEEILLLSKSKISMSLPIWILLKDMPLTNVVFVILEKMKKC